MLPIKGRGGEAGENVPRSARCLCSLSPVGKRWRKEKKSRRWQAGPGRREKRKRSGGSSHWAETARPRWARPMLGEEEKGQALSIFKIKQQTKERKDREEKEEKI